MLNIKYCEGRWDLTALSCGQLKSKGADLSRVVFDHTERALLKLEDLRKVAGAWSLSAEGGPEN